MSPTRRAYLSAGLGGGLTALAGCAGQSEGDSPEPDKPTVSNGNRGPFKELSFDGGDLVVGLAPTHGLSGVNLIAPDGTIFEQVSVATGVETVRIPVLSVQAGLNSYHHYVPGNHTLVGVTPESGEASSLEFEMRPDLRFTDIRQYRDGKRGSDFGRLVFTVENVGTAPTWVHDITYRDAPNQATNDPLSETPGIPLIDSVPESGQLVLAPGEEQSYLSSRAPLVFTDPVSNPCNDTVDLVAVAGVATGSTIETHVSVGLGGDVVSAGLVDEYTCNEVTIRQRTGSLGMIMWGVPE